jgi:glycosyltransferase involved in cell wall biosynthesis
LGWRRHEPTDVKAVERRYRHYGTLLKRAAQERSIDVPALVTFNPFVAAFAPLDWCRTIIYYGRDDWSEFGRNTKLIDALRAAQVAMTSRGVTVCAVSRALADRVAGPGRGVVIPNGIDADTWSSHKPMPETLRALKRPIGIYAGTVDDRLDVPALRELARSGSLQTIAVVGPVTDEVVRRQLAEAPSIRLVGRLNQRDLQGALMGADVCLLPHVVTPLTEAMSPLKLYEYLAAGCPVVSTDLPPVRDVHERVILVSDGDYAKAVHTALALGRLDEDERLAIVEANSWANRHEKLIDLMFGAAAN